jgi:MYXO-CTERM domain-containing protein
MSGVIIWNSHAFNLTEQDSTMDQYLNIRFANAADRLSPVQGIFDSVSIFSEDVPPYGTQEVCRTYEIVQGARLFNINSHTHRHGVKFRVWEPPHPACAPDALGNGCFPGDPSQLIYVSTEYTDPVQLNFDPAVLYDSPNAQERTFLYCSLYDNGSTVGSPSVKLQSPSPEAPAGLGNLGVFATSGPCPDSTVACLGGANAGALCGGNPDLCDSGVCNACPVRGGVTTEDEMFILLGSYYVPEPGQALLALAALLTVTALRRRRGRGGAR